MTTARGRHVAGDHGARGHEGLLADLDPGHEHGPARRPGRPAETAGPAAASPRAVAAHRVVVGRAHARADEHVVLDHAAGGDVDVGLDQHPLADRRTRTRSTSLGRPPSRRRSRALAHVGLVADDRPGAEPRRRRRRPRRRRPSRRRRPRAPASSPRGACDRRPQPRALAQHGARLDHAVARRSACRRSMTAPAPTDAARPHTATPASSDRRPARPRRRSARATTSLSHATPATPRATAAAPRAHAPPAARSRRRSAALGPCARTRRSARTRSAAARGWGCAARRCPRCG